MTCAANKFGVMYVVSVSLKDDIMRRGRICAKLMTDPGEYRRRIEMIASRYRIVSR